MYIYLSFDCNKLSMYSSASLSRSSSSVSPLARHSIEAPQSVTSSPVNVLMRNGTTFSVTAGAFGVKERTVNLVVDELQ